MKKFPMNKSLTKQNQKKYEEIKARYDANLESARVSNIKCRNCGKISGVSNITLKRVEGGYECLKGCKSSS